LNGASRRPAAFIIPIGAPNRPLGFTPKSWKQTAQRARWAADPYDNAKAEGLMKTLEVEAVCPMAFESCDDVAQHLPHFVQEVYNKHPYGAQLSQAAAVRGSHPADWQNSGLTMSTLGGALQFRVTFAHDDVIAVVPPLNEGFVDGGRR